MRPIPMSRGAWALRSTSSSIPLLLVCGCAVPPDPLPLTTEAGSSGPGTSTGTLGDHTVSTTSSGTVEPSLESTSASTLGSTDAGTTSAVTATEGTTSTDDGLQTSTTSPITVGTSSTGEEPGSTTSEGGESSSTGPMCVAGEVECDAACCMYDDEICLAGTCEACNLIDDFDLGPPLWDASFDWDIYFGAPASPTNLPVPFGNAVYGTNGNRVTGGMPNDQEIENSEVLTHQVLLGDRLRFSSWHVDEGGAANGWDNKIIELYIGGAFIPLVNCSTGIGSQAFCNQTMGPRAPDDWDVIVLDTSTHSGMYAQIRFRYLSVTMAGTFEQGWYIDELRAGDGCGSPT